MVVELNATKNIQGGDKLSNTELLRNKIDESGMTMVAISEKAGISRETLYNKVNGKTEFTASEIVAMTSILSLTKKERDNIFLN